MVLRRIAPACIEDTGGVFVATPDDPDDYVAAFAARCAAVGIPCDEESHCRLFRREPALNRRIRRAFRVPDASLEPWQLVEANLRDARPPRQPGAALPAGRRRWSATAASSHRSRSPTSGAGTIERIAPRIIVSAAGAWAGQVAGLAGVDLPMSPGKGTMLVYNQRMTDTVVNRCSRPGDGDIMVPVHTVAILGTTDIPVDDPDDYEPTAAEIDALIVEGEKLFPDLRRMRILRAYAGVRPLYAPAELADSAGRRGRPAGSRDLARPCRDRPRRPRRRRELRVDRRRQADDLPADGRADGRRWSAPSSASSRRARRPTRSCPARARIGAYYWLGDRLAAHRGDRRRRRRT